MSAKRAQQITWRDPLGTEQESGPWRADLVLPSFFLGAAALILAYINPVYLGLTARPFMTVIIALLCIAVMAWGLYTKKVANVLLGSGLLLLLIALCLCTQPSQLGISSVGVWPLRVALFLLVAGSWAFLTRPPVWARRALVSIAVPTLLLLACAGGPTLMSAFSTALRLNGPTAFATPIPAHNFSPYWLAVDTRGRLYATAASGGFIMAFDPSGMPLGSIRPAIASEPDGTGPGLLPIGYPTPTAIPTPGGIGIGNTAAPPIPFCGIATDAQDNLYMVDPYNNKLLRLGRDGKINKRLPLPEKFTGARGCLATDADHIYVSSGFGAIFIMDYEGVIKREVQLDYQPFGVAPDGKGNLLVLGPNELSKISIATGEKEAAPPPPKTGEARVRYQTILATKGGEILGADLANSRVVRIDPDTGDLLGTVGSTGSLQTGYWPGQFQSLGGMAQDSEGHIYIADWQLGVIQRFTLDGELQGVIWAPGEPPPAPPIEIE